MPKVTKKAAKNEKGRKGKKVNGLRRHQIRVLSVLAGASGPMTKREISEQAGITVPLVQNAIGPAAVEERPAHDEKVGYKCLSSLRHVRVSPDSERGTAYEITKAGKTAYDAWTALTGGILPAVNPGPPKKKEAVAPNGDGGKKTATPRKKAKPKARGKK